MSSADPSHPRLTFIKDREAACQRLFSGSAGQGLIFSPPLGE